MKNTNLFLLFEFSVDALQNEVNEFINLLSSDEGDKFDLKCKFQKNDSDLKNDFKTLLKNGDHIENVVSFSYKNKKHQEFRFPMPYHGIFILSNNLFSKNQKWNWHPRLISSPGIFPIKKTNKKLTVFLDLS